MVTKGHLASSKCGVRFLLITKIIDLRGSIGVLILYHITLNQGCDGSVLLDGSASGPSEQDAPPNLSLRKQAFTIINDLRALVHKACGQVVSCADITALAARDSVVLV